MDFITLLLCVAFGYLLWKVKTLEEQVEKLSPKQRHVTAAVIQESAKPSEEVFKADKIAAEKEPIEVKPAWEFKMGAWAYTAVGGVALLLGLGFLLRFAIENNLISPAFRIALGLLLGGVLVGLGYWLQARMQYFAHVLVGTGLGAWYLSLYAATIVYSLIPNPIGFVLICMVTAAGIALALYFNTQYLAVFALFGGYLTPFMLGTELMSPHTFFVYLLILNAVMLTISWYKPWRILPGLSFAGTILACMTWLAGNTVDWTIPFTYSGLLFAQFFIRNLMRISKGKLDQADYLLLGTNPLLFFTMMASLIPSGDQHRLWMALLAVGFALVHFIVAYWPNERTAYIGLGSTFLAIAAPIYFKENRWFMLAWTYEALMLGIIAKQLSSRWLKIFSHILFFMAAITLANDSFGLIAGPTAWLNVRMLVFVLAIAPFTAMSWYDEQKRKQDDARDTFVSIHLVVTYALALVAFTSEINLYYFDRTLLMSAASTVLGALAIIIGLHIKSFELRVSGLVTIALAMMTIIFKAMGITPEHILLSLRTLTLLISIVSIAAVRIYLHTHDKNVSKDESLFWKTSSWLGANVLLWFLISIETTDGTRLLGGTDQAAQVSLSVAWLVYAIALVVNGIIRKSKLSRWSALALFGLVIAKILLIDTAELDNFARFVTFISLGGVLMVAGFLYNRFKTRIEG